MSIFLIIYLTITLTILNNHEIRFRNAPPKRVDPRTPRRRGRARSLPGSLPGSVVGAPSSRVPTIIATGFSPERDFPFGIGGYTGDNGSRSIGTSLWLMLPDVFRGGFDLRLLLVD